MENIDFFKISNFYEIPKNIKEIKKVELGKIKKAEQIMVEEVDNTIEIGTLPLVVKSPSYSLQSFLTIEISLDIIEDITSNSSDELFSTNIKDIEIDPEDFQGVTFEDAMKLVKEKNKPEKVNWSNNAYRN